MADGDEHGRLPGEIAAAWIRYRSRSHDDDLEAWTDPDWWAAEYLMSSEFREDEAHVREVLCALIEAAPDDEALGAIGAGPLEDFVSEDEDGLAWIEARAVVSENFRKALRNVWVWHLNEWAFMRVEQAAGKKLARPRNRVDVVPGDRPGTIHITVNGIVTNELEVDPEHVWEAIQLIKPVPQRADDA